MTLTKDIADMALYQLYAYQEGLQPPNTNLWKKVGDVKALPLPMACTLTQVSVQKKMFNNFINKFNLQIPKQLISLLLTVFYITKCESIYLFI